MILPRKEEGEVLGFQMKEKRVETESFIGKDGAATPDILCLARKGTVCIYVQFWVQEK